MKVNQLLTEERAVSPVIGVILMVAITVILAAVIGTFVLGLGQNVSSTPQASFSFDYNPNSGSSGHLQVTHTGGDSLTSDNTEELDISVDGTDVDVYGNASDADGTSNSVADWADNDATSGDQLVDLSSSSVSAGNAAFVSGADLSSGQTVRVVWTGSNGNSATLASYKVPS